jgi:hypothetical protein
MFFSHGILGIRTWPGCRKTPQVAIWKRVASVDRWPNPGWENRQSASQVFCFKDFVSILAADLTSVAASINCCLTQYVVVATSKYHNMLWSLPVIVGSIWPAGSP